MSLSHVHTRLSTQSKIDHECTVMHITLGEFKCVTKSYALDQEFQALNPLDYSVLHGIVSKKLF